MITREEVPGLMLAACPSFADAWVEVEKEHRDDEGGRLHYLDAGELIRHMVRLSQRGSAEEFHAIFQAIERMAVEGDEYVRTLAVIGYLEGFQMETVTSAGIDPDVEFRPRVGPVSARWWVRIDRFWAGDATALHVEEP